LPTEQDRLSEFLQQVERLLFSIVADGIGVLPPHLQEPARNAWHDVQSRLSDLQEQLKLDEGLRPRLAVAGLTGANLDFKLRGFDHARRRYSATPVPRWLKPVLKWINILLGSLATVMPGAELVKEYKDAIEQGIDEAEKG